MVNSDNRLQTGDWIRVFFKATTSAKEREYEPKILLISKD